MIIHGITVSVGYAGQLAEALPRWVAGLESCIVATTPADTQTQDVARRAGAIAHQTDVFTAHGAAFNKGAAIAEAAERIPFDHWLLLFDADVVPPADWLSQLLAMSPQRGNLYGARRRQRGTGRPLGDREPCGFFLLFHGSDPNAQVRPLVDTHWMHAGNYDTTFAARWPADRQIILPLDLEHIGEPHRNWWGIGNTEAMNRMRRERLRRGGWQHERIDA